METSVYVMLCVKLKIPKRLNQEELNSFFKNLKEWEA